MGRRGAARADLEAAVACPGDSKPLARYFLATLDAQEGAADAAIRELELSRGWANLRYRAQRDPDLKPLRNLPGFIEWLKRGGD
jgi:hypothetical protein